jgi:two-component system chemotaxis response regulator CheY
MNILVVDDEPTYRMLLEQYLRKEGWSVHTAADGEEGMKKLTEVKIDFIISDVYMPRMDGVKFQTARREIPGYEEVPFLFVSGNDDEYTLQAARSSKNVGFIRKTKPLNELKTWIDYLMTPAEKRPATRPPR